MELYASDSNPIPSGAVVGHFVGVEGLRIRYARWAQTGNRLKGTVCVFPGRGEYIEKYFEVIGELRSRGFAVAAMDWRGQGGSDRELANPRKGYVDDFAQYDDDLRRFMVEIVLPDSPAPYFGLAHSMGGNILLRAARLRDCWFDRIVLVSPMVKLMVPSGAMALGRRLIEIATYLGFGGNHVPGGGDTPIECRPFPGNRLTSDEKRLARACGNIEATPALGLGSPTIQWLYAANRAMAVFGESTFPESVQVPLLMFGASHDRIVSPVAIEKLASEMRAGSFMLIPGSRHEILMERDYFREQFWAAFDVFIPGTPLYDMPERV